MRRDMDGLRVVAARFVRRGNTLTGRGYQESQTFPSGDSTEAGFAPDRPRRDRGFPVHLHKQNQ